MVETKYEVNVTNAVLAIIILYFVNKVILPFAGVAYYYVIKGGGWLYKSQNMHQQQNVFDDSACWMRLSVACQICLKEALLDVLHDQSIGGLPTDKYSLHSAIWRFYSARKKDLAKEIKPYQWDIMCHTCSPGMCPLVCRRYGVADSRDFDITCIITLIMYTTNLPPPPGKNGWKQKASNLPDTDTSKGAFVLRAREMRNWAAHCSVISFSSPGAFEDKWTELIDILKGLGYQNMRRFNKMKTSPLDSFIVQKITSLQEHYQEMETEKSNKSDVSLVQDELSKLNILVFDVEAKLDMKGDQSELTDLFKMLQKQKIATEQSFSLLERDVVDLHRRVQYLEANQAMLGSSSGMILNFLALHVLHIFIENMSQ